MYYWNQPSSPVFPCSCVYGPDEETLPDFLLNGLAHQGEGMWGLVMPLKLQGLGKEKGIV